MLILNKPDQFIVSALGEQTPEDGIQYRRSVFTIADGNRIFNTLTGEALEDATESELVRRWFYVPVWLDEYALAYTVRQKYLLTQKRPGIRINMAVIYLTTGCNAKCEYCFEDGYTPMTMTEQTARDAAQWLAKRCDNDKTLHLRWFGGEPLTNIPAIEAVSKRLKDNGISFKSDMFTNGDLLRHVPDDAFRRWNLKTVQFTIDDVGAEYERIKGLPHGAFDRITEQVRRLSGLGIRVRIRTHYRGDAEPCKRVADAFNGMDNVSMYSMLLYGTGDTADYEGLLKVEDYLIQCSLYHSKFPKIRYGANCMADNAASVCITPDGHLSPCEHYAYGEDYGSIYDRSVNVSQLRKWSDKQRNHCNRCVLYPLCSSLVHCPGEGGCTPEKQFYDIATIKRALRSANHD